VHAFESLTRAYRQRVRYFTTLHICRKLGTSTLLIKTWFLEQTEQGPVQISEASTLLWTSNKVIYCWNWTCLTLSGGDECFLAVPAGQPIKSSLEVTLALSSEPMNKVQSTPVTPSSVSRLHHESIRPGLRVRCPLVLAQIFDTHGYCAMIHREN
jgi:hypothetical protein